MNNTTSQVTLVGRTDLKTKQQLYAGYEKLTAQINLKGRAKDKQTNESKTHHENGTKTEEGVTMLKIVEIDRRY